MLSVVVSSIWIWRRNVDYHLKAASMIVGALLMTPYMFDYDMVALAPAILLLVRFSMRAGWMDYEKSILALAWFAPLFARPSIIFLNIPLGVSAMLVLYLLILYKAHRELNERERVSQYRPAFAK